jgi:hypothetical protein
MAFADIVQWLSGSDKTGTLVVDGPKYTKKIHFSRGTVVAVSSDNPKEMIGYYMVGWGHFSEEILERVIEMQKHCAIALGELVVKLGYIKREELDRVVQVKTMETIYDLVLWEEGNFRFLEGQLPERDYLWVNLPPSSFLYEGFRQRDERKRIRKLIPSSLHIPVLIANPSELTDGEKVILATIDGKTSIEGIALHCRVPEFMILSFIYKCVKAGSMRVDAPPEGPQQVPGQSLPPWHDMISEIEDMIERERLLDTLEQVAALREKFSEISDVIDFAAEIEYQIHQKLDQGPITPNTVLEPTVGLDELMNLDCAPAEGFVLSRVNGFYTVKDVLKQLPGSDLRNRIILHNLMRRGLVKPRVFTGVRPVVSDG